jgi:glucokinase
MKYSIGVDIGGTNIPVALVDQAGKIVDIIEKKTQAHDGPDSVVKRIAESVKELCSKVDNCSLAGIGLGAPGALDIKKGIIITSPNLSGWNNVPLLKMLNEATGLKVKMDNDANCAAIGEHWIGGARGSNNAIIITLGTGVGGGIIIDGKIFRGSHGTAGELGHITIEKDGRLCNCGNKGCLEAYASATGAVITAKELGLKVDTAYDIFVKAEQKDELAQKALEISGRYLGIGIASFANIFDPDVIVVGGGFSSAYKYLLPAAKDEAYNRSFKTIMDKLSIKRAELGNNAGIIGAARLSFTE